MAKARSQGIVDTGGRRGRGLEASLRRMRLAGHEAERLTMCEYSKRTCTECCHVGAYHSELRLCLRFLMVVYGVSTYRARVSCLVESTDWLRVQR